MKRVFLYGLIAVLALSLGVLMSCGKKSSSSSKSADDDAAYTCSELYTEMMVTCDFQFAGVTAAEAIAACNADESPYGMDQACGECISVNYGNCTPMGQCLLTCGGGAIDDDASPSDDDASPSDDDTMPADDDSAADDDASPVS